MATQHPRIQVTVDEELARAMAEAGPSSTSRSRLVRDLAVRGARSLREERERQADATEYLLKILDGEVDHDFDAVRELYEARGKPCP